jgi:hypothetical protein
MQYMLLILEPHGQRAARSDAEGRAAYDKMLRYADALQARGMLRAAQSLRTDTEGVRVQVRRGRATLVDGPFSESKEMVGGYFLVECASKDDAVAIASQIPAGEWATVEVREFGPCFM